MGSDGDDRPRLRPKGRRGARGVKPNVGTGTGKRGRVRQLRLAWRQSGYDV